MYVLLRSFFHLKTAIYFARLFQKKYLSIYTFVEAAYFLLQACIFKRFDSVIQTSHFFANVLWFVGISQAHDHILIYATQRREIRSKLYNIRWHVPLGQAVSRGDEIHG